MGLQADLPAAIPTTEGVPRAMAALKFGRGRRIGVPVLYPDKRPPPSCSALSPAAGAIADPVLPYVYGSAGGMIAAWWN